MAIPKYKNLYNKIIKKYPKAKNNKKYFVRKFINEFSKYDCINYDVLNFLNNPNLENAINFLYTLDLSILEITFLGNSLIGEELYNLVNPNNP